MSIFHANFNDTDTKWDYFVFMVCQLNPLTGFGLKITSVNTRMMTVSIDFVVKLFSLKEFKEVIGKEDNQKFQ